MLFVISDIYLLFKFFKHVIMMMMMMMITAVKIKYKIDTLSSHISVIMKYRI